MTRRRRVALAATVAAGAAAALWWWSSDRAATPASRSGGGLAAGEHRAYDLTWDGASVADASGLPGGAEAYIGEVEVRARLVVRGLGRDGDASLVGYRLEDVTAASYRVLGQDILAGIDLTAGELVAAIGPDGGLLDLRPDPAAPPAADVLLRAIVQQSVVTLSEGDAWDAVEPGPSGVARMRYRRDEAGSLIRTRTGYVSLAALPGACESCREQLDGVAAIELDRAGVVRDLVDEEQLVVVDDRATRLTIDSRFTLHASTVTTTRRSAPVLDGRKVIAAAGSGFEGGDDDLERARGWSLGRIGTTIVRFLATGATPGETTWMHGVAAYLRLHPEACRELLRMFAAPGLPAEGRDLIASMLVAAGTPSAQTALRDGIDWLARGHADDEVARVLSRTGLLAEPTTATAEWLAGLRADRDDHAATSSAATLALGAAIGGLDDRAEAARHAAALRDELAGAGDPATRIELLAALGNAGRPDDAAAIAALAGDPEAAVRHQVTVALRKLDDAAAVPALTALAGDGDGTVRAAAIEMLGRRDLGAAAANRVAGEAIAAGARADELGALIRLLAPHAADAGVAATLRSLLDVVERPELRTLIHHALG